MLPFFDVVLVTFFYMIKFVLLGFLGVNADLPIHCLYDSLSGEWEFLKTGETSSDPLSCGSSYPNSNILNIDILPALDRMTNPESFMKLKLTTFTRSVSGERSDWRELVVLNEASSVVGKWTSIYDQGFEIRTDSGLTMMSVADYGRSDEVACKIKKASNSDQTNEHGITPCYISNCDRNKFGFARQEDSTSPTGFTYFCFASNRLSVAPESSIDSTNIGQSITKKIVSPFDTDGNSTPPTKIVSPTNDDGSINLSMKKTAVTAKPHNRRSSPNSRQLGDGPLSQVSHSAMHVKFNSNKLQILSRNARVLKNNFSLSSVLDDTLDMEGTSGNISPSNYACAARGVSKSVSSSSLSADAGNIDAETNAVITTDDQTVQTVLSALPDSFSWVKFLKQSIFNGDNNELALDYDLPIVNQQSCGSCYALAAAAMLNYRYLIALRRRGISSSETKEKIGTFGIQDQLQCDFYSQGCEGGYPILSTRFAFESGVSPSSSIPSYNPKTPGGDKLYTADSQPKDLHDCLGKLNTNNVGFYDVSNRWFASNYGYVGGFYESADFNSIQREVFRSGPVAVAFKVPENFSDATDSTIFSSEDYSTLEDGSLQCPVTNVPFTPAQPGVTVNGWQYTDHAVVIVGWASDNDSKSICKSSGKYWIIKNTWGTTWGMSGYSKICMGDNLGGIENQAYFADPDFTRGAGKDFA